ncbi:MAG: helix-turn-helix transcriptional regulator [Bacteroidia bacterium]|nr:helix-turn-helix transcriptional regulator [Bacteroidia bacterium]
MKTRIIEFLKSENKTSAQLAEEIGVQPSGISHILSGRNKPSLDFVIKMLEKYPFLSTDWLLFGKGDMYKEPSMQTLFNESVKSDNSVEITEKQDIRDYGNEKSEDNPKDFELKGKRRATRVQKIVWFFSDNCFREFIPEE